MFAELLYFKGDREHRVEKGLTKQLFIANFVTNFAFIYKVFGWFKHLFTLFRRKIYTFRRFLARCLTRDKYLPPIKFQVVVVNMANIRQRNNKKNNISSSIRRKYVIETAKYSFFKGEICDQRYYDAPSTIELFICKRMFRKIGFLLGT